MAWIMLLAAGALEIVWAVAMKQSLGFTRLWPSLVMVTALAASMGLLALSMKTLQLGTAYVAWTGIGAVGTFAVGILFLGEQATATRLLAAFLILAGVLLLKASTD
ncbi:DMT family transporter [Hyphomicrobium facile]|uniref:Guanidinium exporter n=1 Tax=Hyphomicrobium facile TaxID=51670 RepID=A0A1I7MTM5_9HYPH|nr:multidrug efflux SMR transporter [Hyphomicrobium facile]SFV25754.1 quaternary ammonium compound-resistance protein SugE [Hyphomicrobium facile]